jgi:hypothetical protein
MRLPRLEAAFRAADDVRVDELLQTFAVRPHQVLRTVRTGPARSHGLRSLMFDERQTALASV